ncbi:MAG: radical SAM protein [Methylotenera sp.]|nr:radical SAM protein [Methylotenera sp.]
MEITFGPVPSRRLGRSLGINNIPPKHCTYSCIYCQVGPTAAQENALRTFYLTEQVYREISQRWEALHAQGEKVDYLTFVPDGEPTLDSQLSAHIDALRPLGLPIAVISNASLIWRPEVRNALSRADWVSVKVDSVNESTWRRINQPHPDLVLSDILNGIRTFAASYGGTLASETLLVEGVNDSVEEVEAVARFISEAGIRLAYLAIPHRPPADSTVACPKEVIVTRAWHIMAKHVAQVELLTAYEGDDFSLSDDPRDQLLAVTAVHPMRESAVLSLLERSGANMALVQELLDSGELQRVSYEGCIYYIRRMRRP